jgi:CarD family transcriptional regulator
MYNIGDRLVYPMHGAGIIEAIEEKEVLDEKRFYYVMKMPVSDVKVMIPVNNTEEIGIREVSSIDIAREVLDKFIQTEADTASNWNKRYRENMEKIRSGDLFDIAYVAKTLMLKEKMKGLSMGERKMLSSTKQILVSELVIALDTTADELMEKLANIVAVDLEKMAEAVEAAGETAEEVKEEEKELVEA